MRTITVNTTSSISYKPELIIFYFDNKEELIKVNEEVKGEINYELNQIIIDYNIDLINKYNHLNIGYDLKNKENKNKEVIRKLIKENKQKAELIAKLNNLEIKEILNINFVDYNEVMLIQTNNELTITKNIEITYEIK